MAFSIRNYINEFDKRYAEDEANRKQLDNFYSKNPQFHRVADTPNVDTRVRGLITPPTPSIPSSPSLRTSSPNLSIFSAVDKALGKSSYDYYKSNNTPSISAMKTPSVLNNTSAPNEVFGQKSWNFYKANNPDTPDLIKPIGYALESPFRIPFVNRLTKAITGDSGLATNAPVNTYSTDTRNNFLNGTADVVGGLAGFGLKPRLMGANGVNLMTAGDAAGKFTADNIGAKLGNSMASRVASATGRGIVDGAVGNMAYDMAMNKDVKELPKSALIGAAGGAALMGGGKLASEGINKLKVPELNFGNLDSYTPKTNSTPNTEALNVPKPNTLDDIVKAVVADNKPNINTPKLNMEDVYPKNNGLLLNAGKEEIPQVNINDYKTPKMTAKQTQSVAKFDELNNKKGVKWYQDNDGDIYGVYKTPEGYGGSIIDKKGSLSKFNSKSSPADYGFKEVNLGAGRTKEEVLSSLDNIISTLEKHANDEKINTPKFSSPFVEGMSKVVPKASENTANVSVLQKNFPVGSKVSFNANMGRGKGEVIGYKTDKWGNEWAEIDTGVKSQTGVGTIKDFKRIDDDIKLEGSSKNMAANIENNTAQKNIPLPQNESTVTNNDEIAAALGSQVKESKFKTNTWENSPFMADEATQKMVKDIDATYDVQTNDENLQVAMYRLNKDFNGVVDRITKEGIQTAEDSVASGLITNRLIQEAKQTGDYSKVSSWLKVVRPEVTNLAQSLQALSTWKKLTPEGTLLKAQKVVDGAVDNIKKQNPKKFEEVQKATKDITKQMDEIDKKALEQVTNELNNNIDNIINNKPKENSLIPNAKEEPPTLAEQLAQKVESTTKNPRAKKLTVENTLVNTLFNIAKKDLPEVKKIPTNPMDLVKFALKNKDQYREVWKEAQKIISEKFGEDSEEYSMLNDWVESKLKPTFYKNDLNKAISQTLKEKGIDLKKIVKEHYSVNSGVRKDLIETLTKSGLSKEDSESLSNYINNRMKELTKQNKESVLKQMFKNRPTPEQKTMIQKALELNNLGAFKNANYKDLIYEKFGIPQLTNDDIKFITDQMEKVRMLEDPRLRDIEFAGVKQLIANKVVPTFTDKLKAAQRISMLLNTKTMTRNVLGNVIMGGLENVKDIPGAGIDKVLSKFTGKETTLLPSVEGIKTQVKGMKEGFKNTIEDYKLGINTNPSSGQYELPESQAFRSGVMGKLEKVTNLGLSIGDRPFWKGAYDEALRQQLKINKVKEPTEEMIKQAKDLADEKTFQNVSGLVKVFKGLQQAANGYRKVDGKWVGNEAGFGNVILPFVKTPANILDKAIDYSPLGGLQGVYRLVNGLKKNTLNQKQVVDQLGRSVTGSTLISVGYMMAKNGVLTGQANTDKDVAALEKQAGKSPYAIKTGDTYRTIDWAQPAAIPLMIGADIFHQGKNEKGLGNIIASAVVSGGNTLFQQSLLTGVQKLFNTPGTTSGGIVENLKNTAMGIPNQFAPSAFKEINQLIDNKQRDTSSDTALGKVINPIKAKIPGLAQTLPVKYDTMGREMTTYKNGNNLWNVGFNPGFTTTYSPSEGEKAALDIFEENGSKTQFPQVMDNKITYTDSKTKKKAVVDLTPKEKQEFQKNVGQRVEDQFKYIHGGTTEDKIKDMEKILRDIKKEEQDKILRTKGLSRK